MNDKIRLTQVSHALRELTGREPPPYRQLWLAVVDGKLASEVINGRHFVRRLDLPTIAVTMGMTEPSERPKRRPAKGASIAA
jgi:hypothetical protein